MTKVNIDSFSINHNNSVVNQEDEYYVSLADKEFLDKNNFPRSSKDGGKVLAKAIRDKKSKHLNGGIIGHSYHLKISANKTLIDSRTLYSLKESKASYVDHICKSDKEFLEVSRDTFQKYINFLKTENTKWLDMAQDDIK